METPLCPYFGKCGGCTSQHISYETQLNNKKSFLLSQLKKHKIEHKEINVFSDKQYHYRNRMDFIFFPKGLGFRRKKSGLIEIKECVISNDKLNYLLKEVKLWFDKNREVIDTFDLVSKKGTLRYAVIRTPEFENNSTISFVLNADSQKQKEHIELIEEFAKTTTATNIVISQVHKHIDSSISEECFAVKGSLFLEENLGKKLKFSSQGFFQNNSVMAKKMVDYSRRLLEKYDTKNSSLIDLYGGVGTFGISLADMFKNVLVVDSYEQSIDSAKKNIEQNTLKHVEAICADVKKISKLSPITKNKKVFVITDPPRTGMDSKTLKYLIDLKPEVIIYVSCNPMLMVKDLKKLTKYYSVDSVAIFDLFPQTNHMESVTELKLI